ncbi:MAG: FKBP-type peptidyl-prolyl cis-trans isomerase [Bacteroidota bacterium]
MTITSRVFLLVAISMLFMGCNEPASTPSAPKPVAQDELNSLIDSASYALGVQNAQFLKQEGVRSFNQDVYNRGFNSTLNDEEPVLDEETLYNITIAYRTELREEAALKAKQEGEDFLRENGTNEGVITTASGLQYKIIREGSGGSPKAEDKVRVNYEGRFLDGKVFDSSYKSGVPAEFTLSNVISGWTEVLQLMKEGSEYEVYLSDTLAYGERGYPGAIPPNSTLIFKIELLEVL